MSENLDLVEELHLCGLPVYVADNEHQDNIVRVYPDGRRIRGTMIRSKFIPEDKTLRN